jgi:hypothetical protein
MFLTIYQPPDLTTEPATWHFNNYWSTDEYSMFPQGKKEVKEVWPSFVFLRFDGLVRKLP